jgi:hypothetical protein
VPKVRKIIYLSVNGDEMKKNISKKRYMMLPGIVSGATLL